MDTKERIEKMMEVLRLNQVQFASDIGLTKATVTQWIKGQTEPSAGHEKRILLTFRQFNPFWLWGISTEPMYRETSKIEKRASIELIEKENVWLREQLADKNEIIAYLKEKISNLESSK